MESYNIGDGFNCIGLRLPDIEGIANRAKAAGGEVVSGPEASYRRHTGTGEHFNHCNNNQIYRVNVDGCMVFGSIVVSGFDGLPNCSKNNFVLQAVGRDERRRIRVSTVDLCALLDPGRSVGRFSYLEAGPCFLAPCSSSFDLYNIVACLNMIPSSTHPLLPTLAPVDP